MSPTRDLRKLAKSATYRLSVLRKILDSSRGTFAARETRLAVCAVTVEALNTWANFSRSYYLSSCLGAFLAPLGSITTITPFSSFNDSIGNAVLLYKAYASPRSTGIWHRRDEPTWHDPNVLLACCNNIGASNYTHMTNALSVGTRFFLDLPVFRNYCAHKNMQTEGAAQNIAPIYGISALLQPLNILLSIPIRRYDPLLKIWLYDIESVVSLLCE